MLSPSERARLKELVEKATPGEWSLPHLANDECSCNCGYVLSEGYCGSVATVNVDNGKKVGNGGNDSPPLEEARANAAYIHATQPNVIRALLADLEAAEQKLEPFCPNCGKHNLKETVTEIHKPFGNRGELSYEAPVIKCADCTFEWTDSRRESAEAEATIRFLGKSLRAAERERDALREAARWIPVSERLPEEDRPVLIAVRLPVDDHAEEVDSAVEVREGTIYTAPNMVIASLYDGSEASDDEVLAWQEKPTFPATPKEQAR